MVKPASWLEIAVGAALIATPSRVSGLLFGVALDDSGSAVARFAGIALLALGATCLLVVSAAPRGAARGLVVFNAAASGLFAWILLTTALHGPLLWPALVLHAGIAAALTRNC